MQDEVAQTHRVKRKAESSQRRRTDRLSQAAACEEERHERLQQLRQDEQRWIATKVASLQTSMALEDSNLSHWANITSGLHQPF